MEPVGRLAQSWPASQSRPASSRFASRIIRTQYYVKQDNQTSYISQETSIPAAMRAQRQDWKYSSPFHSGPVRAEKRCCGWSAAQSHRRRVAPGARFSVPLVLQQRMNFPFLPTTTSLILVPLIFSIDPQIRQMLVAVCRSYGSFAPFRPTKFTFRLQVRAAWVLSVSR